MGLFTMPSLGSDMEDGTLVEWLVREGQPVQRGDIIAVVETQKGAIEIEIFETGTIAKLLLQEGETVPVGAPMAEIMAEVVGVGVEPGPAAAPAPASAAPEAAIPPDRHVASPPRPPPAAVGSGGRILASPAARRLAAERGLALQGLKGTGPGGAIVSADVAAAGGAPAAKPREPARRGIDMGEMRKAIAAAMARSKREIPHYYLQHSIDLETAANWLATANAERAPPQRLLLAALLLKASALALKRYPEFNGHYIEGAFRPADAVHLGVAVAIRGGGLIAPAIHDAETLGIDALMATLRDATQRMRAGRIRSSELTDPTATVSSLGDRGVEGLWGVIYPPQVALIGFGKAERRPAVVDDAVLPRMQVQISLAADHRASDGHRGALLLCTIDTLLQTPEAL
ncbi:MAG: 2-oxo acid dehydrogenase subunit E2 [Alphaproteobacteria bacterium]|nr:2-oxo acid dehydrogenase subunit E2 [Alphaproteobacteria bacterium]MCB9928211.1 2-oxo acid dehydrogenase subunit E2 [Alphaproteobacteria bacterium]